MMIALLLPLLWLLPSLPQPQVAIANTPLFRLQPVHLKQLLI